MKIESQRQSKALLVGIFFIISPFFYYTGISTFIAQGTAVIAYPFIRTAAAISQASQAFLSHWQSYDNLLNAYQLLIKKYEALLERQTIHLGTAFYEEKTRELRDFKERYNLPNAQIGSILAKTLTSQEQTMLVNVGSKNGIKQDMIALYKLQIIGRVTEVYPSYCKILLISDTRSKIAATSNTTQAKGIIEGKNNATQYSFSLVSHLVTLLHQDFILSTGEGLIFPEGFCLGQIKNFTKAPGDLFYTINVEPLVDIASLSYCLLIDKTNISLA